MFREFECGCIFSVNQGRVRTCSTHKPAVTSPAAGREGNLMTFPGKMTKVVKRYPTNGIMVANWTGR